MTSPISMWLIGRVAPAFSNYGFWGRLRVGVFDLLGVWWLIKRKRPTPDVREIGARSATGG